MFATFDSKSPGTSASSNSSRDTASSTSTPQQAQRQKRQQVSRACDRCRTYRIKCDNDFPCTNCRSKDQQCSKKRGPVKTATLAQARHQIDHLEHRVKELELELQDERRASAANATPGTDSDVGFPALRRSSLSSPESDADATLSPVHHAADGLPTDKFSKGVYAKQRDSSQHTTWYGPGSLHYFALRLNRFLELSLPEAQPICNPLVVRHARPLDDSTVANDYLSPTQEQYFLDRYWQSYHTVFPVLDEADFKEHYTSLWAKPNRERKPSAVVDIMLALCIQDTAATTGDNQSPDDALHSDTAVPSHYRYYQRCRTLLLAELEIPTISTLQCQLLCTLYLCSRMLQNTADSTCAHAVRIAYMLGLHMEPPNSLPRRERELRKRLWWTLHVLETKISLKLGRPFLMHSSEATCPMPSDDYETAASGSSFAPLGENATWLTWSLHLTKLFRIARAASTDFYRRDIRCFHRGSKTAMVQSEACFGILKPHMDRLEQWTIDLPQVLQPKRQTGGRPFSVDNRGLTLEIEPFAPLWLQRQRFLLELMYHDLCTNLYRPFIPFDAMQHSGSRPLTDSAAVKCAAHATALTNILHEVLSKTSILAGFHEALQWQWNAALSLVGFVLAYRASPLMPGLSTSRAAITTSVAVFDLFAGMDGFFAAAGTAADILRELSAALDVIAPKNSASPDIEGLLAAPVPSSEMHAMDGNWFASPLQMPDIPDPFGCDDSVMQDLWTAETEFDLVNAVDIYPGLDLLLPGSRVLGQGHWEYAQPDFDKE
ncbi:Transcription factor [Akanthomyces lecanii RCEF 1005]|uniref:Transcription factor n=1 Tax=Akanthomyces lecanii RCEF 1005 TaxID=1081108 RepID=A0A162N545_CORDF|nr:Transcription factor [Akanthomyces lecanii RCEF 1005]